MVIAPPTANSVTADSTADTTIAVSPEVNRNGRSGTRAPIENITNEEPAAAQGEPSPSCMSIPSSSRAWVSRAICGSFITSAAIRAAVSAVDPLRLEDLRQLPAPPLGHGSRSRAPPCGSAARRPRAAPSSRRTRPLAIENAPARSPANPAMTTTSRCDTGSRHAEDQREVRHEAVVHPEDRGPQGAGLAARASCSAPTGPGCGVIRDRSPRRRSTEAHRLPPDACSVDPLRAR